MAVVKRMKTNDSLIDICEYPEFQNKVTGLNIAWRLGHLNDVWDPGGCFVVTENEETGKTRQTQIRMPETACESFVHMWSGEQVSSVVLDGVCSGTPTNVTVNIKYCNVAISYPCINNTSIPLFEKEAERSIQLHFNALELSNKYVLGGKIVLECQCRYLQSRNDLLNIAAACMQTPGFLLRWITYFRSDVAEGTDDYYALTYRQKRTAAQLLRQFRGVPVNRIRAVMSLNQKYLSVALDLETASVLIIADRWLANELKAIRAQLNINIFLAYFAGKDKSNG